MDRCEAYWRQYLRSLPADVSRPARFVEAFFFGTRPDGAAEIAALVLDGVKTATGSPLWSYEADGKRVPAVGDHWIVTDGFGGPLCVIRTASVEILPFDLVGEEYARDGGEEDRSLASWRPMYWSYIESECARIGRLPAPDAPLVMERFAVVYAEPLRPGSDPGGAR